MLTNRALPSYPFGDEASKYVVSTESNLLQGTRVGLGKDFEENDRPVLTQDTSGPSKDLWLERLDVDLHQVHGSRPRPAMNSSSVVTGTLI